MAFTPFVADITTAGAVGNLYGFGGFDPSGREGVQWNTSFLPGVGPGGRNIIRTEFIPMAAGTGFGANQWFNGSFGDEGIPYGTIASIKYYLRYSNTEGLVNSQNIAQPWGCKPCILTNFPDVQRVISTLTPHTSPNLQWRLGKNIDGPPNETIPDVTMTPGWHAVQLVIIASSGSGANDGEFRVYLDNDDFNNPNAVSSGTTALISSTLGSLEGPGYDPLYNNGISLTVDIAAIEIQQAFDSNWYANIGGIPTTTDAVAFPGAEGYGRETRHAYGLVGAGTDPTIIHVTNLNDSGAGSLRAAIESSGPRVVVFDTSGTIVLDSDIVAVNPYCYVAGQSAPEPGCAIQEFGIVIQTHDILITHLRGRIGDVGTLIPPGSGGQAVVSFGDNADKVVIDHCSIGFAIYNALETNHGDITLSNCILAYALNESVRSAVGGGCALVNGGDAGNRLTIIRSLIAHNPYRSPEVRGTSTLQLVNNVIYDFGHFSGYPAALIASTGSPTGFNFQGALPGESAGTEYYVNPVTGNDGNTGLSPAQAFLTLNFACPLLTPGDTLWLMDGVYDEWLLNSQFATVIPSGTSWLATGKVRLAKYPGANPTIRPSSGLGATAVVWLVYDSQYIEFDGIIFDGLNANGNVLSFGGDTLGGHTIAHHCRVVNSTILRSSLTNVGQSGIGSGGNAGIGFFEFQNNIVTGNPGGSGVTGYGIYNGSPDTLIEHNHIYDTKSAGIHNYNSAGILGNNCVIRNNRIHGITQVEQDRGWGILLSGHLCQVYNNLIYDLDLPDTDGNDAGIYVFSGNGNSLWNNTVENCHNAGGVMKGILVTGSADSTIVRNNIARNCDSNFIDAGIGTLWDHNLFSNLQNPNYVDPDNGDYSIIPPSDAIDQGVTVASVTTDIRGVPRPFGPAYDIGAYEYTTDFGLFFIDAVGNGFIAGPTVPPGRHGIIVNSSQIGSQLFQFQNYVEGVTLFQLNGTINPLVAGPCTPNYNNLTIRSITGLESYIEDNVGAFISSRDTLDALAISTMLARTGTYIDSQTDVGGFPSLAVNASVFVPVSNPHVLGINGYSNLENQLYALKLDVEGPASGGGGGGGGGGGTEPPNLTHTTAIPITPIPYTNAQNVFATTVNANRPVWYVYTETVRTGVIGFHFWGVIGGDLLATYRPHTEVYMNLTGNPVVTEDELTFVGQTSPNCHAQLPIRLGETYYFYIRPTIGSTATSGILNSELQRNPMASGVPGNIYIRSASIDSAQLDAGFLGLPGGFIDTASQTITGFVPYFICGESGDILPNGISMWADEFGSAAPFPPLGNNIYIYDRNFAQLATFVFECFGAPLIRTNNATARFWILNKGVGLNPTTFRFVTEQGTLGPLHSIVGSAGCTGFATSPDETILYMGGVAGSANSEVKRYDIVNDVFLADLAAAVASYRVSDILVMSDGSVVVLYFKSTVTRAAQIIRYAADGTVLFTLALTFSTTITGIDPRIGYSADGNSFWFWGHLSTGFGDARRIRLDGVQLVQSLTADAFNTTIEQEDPPLVLTSDSCPIIELREASTPGGGGGGGGGTTAPAILSGIYKLVPGKVNDTLWANFTTGATTIVRIPRPFAKTFLLGDD